MSKQSQNKSQITNKNSDLDLAFQGINKKFGEGALMKLGDAKKMNVSVISTGSLAVDLSLGAGGFHHPAQCVLHLLRSHEPLPENH